MKIGTWNLERLKHLNKSSEITLLLENQNCDILVLTEYDERIKPKGYNFEIETENLSILNSKNYKSSERRVKIFSKFEISNFFETYDAFTSCCAEIITDHGKLLVYGTVLGVFGNRDKNFIEDLPKQMEDYKKLSENRNFCIIGDYNISFCDNYYFTNFGRKELLKCFTENNLEITTKNVMETIDHITINSEFVKNFSIEIEEWNVDKKLSDHKGISINLK